MAATLLVLAIVLLLVPVSEPGKPGPWRSPDPSEQARSSDRGEVSSRERKIRALLDRRAAALRNRNLAAFMASVDPQAPVPFRRRQRALFHNLADVPLARWFYELDSDGTASSPPPATMPEPPRELWAPGVVLNYALTGVDVVPTRKAVNHLFARRGDTWYLTGGTAARERQRLTWRGPWYYGRCRVIVTDTGLVLGHDGNRELMRRVARIMKASVTAVTEVWGPDWSQQVGVLLPASRSELRSLVGPTFAVDGIAAVAIADRVNTVTDRVAGPRVVFNTSTAAELSDTTLRVVLQHEITHIATRTDTVDGAPMWLLEGFADYVGYRGSGLSSEETAPDLARRVRQRGPPSGLPSDDAFKGSGSRMELAYQQGWSVVDFLVRTVGERRVVGLYHRIAETGSSADVDEALRDIAGMSTNELVRRWRGHLRHTFG
ncbi:hypothetical protein FHX42_002987 [Saccharopolyspora lacisalsi]|uniref:Peptidase MA-like domain-containing protein n=1 Tax=Halosaccharopolyspora lacisalsi TaxID=1000566 RepID=A0A839E2I7_9PSEU|nr:hypothetical protein [Halosaccharopolyspora lacisalsi]